MTYYRDQDVYVFRNEYYTKLRKRRKFTLDELAIKTGISKTTLSKYGTGARVPRTPSHALLLSDALKCDVRSLYRKAIKWEEDLI